MIAYIYRTEENTCTILDNYYKDVGNLNYFDEFKNRPSLIKKVTYRKKELPKLNNEKRYFKGECVTM